MERYGSITTPVSVPRLIVGAMLAAGVAVLILAFTQYGLLAGLAVSVIPAALCILWVTLRNPAISMLGLFVVNYFIMALTRYAHDLPFGMILDALIFYNFLIITLQALIRPIEWKRASSGLTVVAAIWMAYCILEIVNPESVSVAGWFSSVRSIAFYFFFIVVLTQLTMTEYKYLKYMLAVWSVLTLIAVGKACMQKFFGFNAAENYWLFVLGGRSTHIIHSGVRYFSFFSDAANFGGSMGLSMVVFSISALYYRNSWMKLYLLLVAAAACYGMLRHADLGNPQRTGRTVRGLLGLHHDVAQHQDDRRGCFPDHRSLHLPEIHHHRAGKQHYPACPQRLQHKRPLVPGAPGKPGQTARTDG